MIMRRLTVFLQSGHLLGSNAVQREFYTNSPKCRSDDKH